MKFLIIFTIILASLTLQIFTENLQKKVKTFNKVSHKKIKQIDEKIKTQLQNIFNGPAVGPKDLPDAPIYYEGWVKYFHYQDSSVSDKPKSFFRNDAFYAQSRLIKNQTELQSKDSKGTFIYIPTDMSFFVTVLPDSVNILSSRSNQIVKTVDTLNIDFIKPIPETKRDQGGVKDFGKFNEGYCFKVLTTVPGEYYQMSISSASPEKGSQEVWIFCTDTLDQKRYIMSALVGLKLKKQHKLGHFLDSKEAIDDEKAKKEALGKTIIAAGDDGGKIAVVKDIRDGYWVLLQDWSQCTLKCGGGLQYQQLMCVPPKEGGKPCDGNPIRTRPCNSQKCPPIIELQKVGLNRKSNPLKAPNMNKPIVKAMRVSQRPLRYDKCHIKEGDALISRISENAEGFEGIIETFPARMVMNNRTITIYQDDTYATILATFLLQASKLARVESKSNCFKLISNNKKMEVCELQGTKGNFVEEWDYDFNLFKFQCRTAMPEIKISTTEEKKLENEYKEKVSEAKIDIVRERQQAIKQAVEKNDEILLEKKVQGTQTITLQAVQKELQLEDLLEKEEKQKEEIETEEITQKIEEEKKKDECLNKMIQQRELEDQYNLSRQESEKQIEKLKEEAKQEIIIKRNLMKTKINNMRKKNERRKNMLMQKLMSVRTTMASKMQKASKAGSKTVCQNAKADQNSINAYCENNFYDNFYKLVDCKDMSNFCYSCCENEFGDVHVAERDDCYDMCDGKSKTVEQKSDKGKWIWTETLKLN